LLSGGLCLRRDFGGGDAIRAAYQAVPTSPLSGGELLSYADDTATIHTHQRRIITKLKNNPAATEIEDISFDGTAGAVFEIAADLISFRSGRRKLSAEQAQAAAANLRREAA
jgi:hypothetical protein